LFIFPVNSHILITMATQKKPPLRQPQSNPVVVVISGPSGVGKDASIVRIKETGARTHYVVTATTRPKRQSEINGVHYHFLTLQQFESGIHHGQFLEYATVYGNYYGVLRSEVKAALQKGDDVIIKVDVQGAATLKKKIPEAIFIFLLPDSLTDLANRLKQRNDDNTSEMDLRLNTAKAELKQKRWFDYVVVNRLGELDKTAQKISAIIVAEKCRTKSRNVVL